MAENRNLIALVKKYRWQIAVVAIVIVLLAGLFAVLNRTERSVAAYCSMRQEQREKLKNATGSAYSSTLLPGVKSDKATDFADAMAKLEKVAPEEVEPNVHVQRLAFEKVAQDPSQTMGAALGAITAEENAKAWTKQHCGELNN